MRSPDRWVFLIDVSSDRDFTWWKLGWNFGNSRDNVFDMYWDSREKLCGNFGSLDYCKTDLLRSWRRWVTTVPRDCGWRQCRDGLSCVSHDSIWQDWMGHSTLLRHSAWRLCTDSVSKQCVLWVLRHYTTRLSSNQMGHGTLSRLCASRLCVTIVCRVCRVCLETLFDTTEWVMALCQDRV